MKKEFTSSKGLSHSPTYPGTTLQKQRGLSRIDSKDTHGWFVRVYNESVTYSKLFSDRKFGGVERAYHQAIAFRNALYEEVGKTFPTRRVVRRDRRNKTGVIGVCRTRKRNQSGSYNEFFSVSWSPHYGGHKCRMFSIAKYGEQEAFRRACELRRQVELEIHGKTWVEIPKEVPLYHNKKSTTSVSNPFQGDGRP